MLYYRDLGYKALQYARFRLTTPALEKASGTRICPVASAPRENVMEGTVTPAELAEFHERQAAVIGRIFAMPIDELFIARDIRVEIPVGAKLFMSVQCASCGEMVAEHRARVRNGEFVCIPCAGELWQRVMKGKKHQKPICRSKGKRDKLNRAPLIMSPERRLW